MVVVYLQHKSPQTVLSGTTGHRNCLWSRHSCIGMWRV